MQAATPVVSSPQQLVPGPDGITHQVLVDGTAANCSTNTPLPAGSVSSRELTTACLLRVLCKARRWPHASPPSLSLSLERWLRTAVRCDNATLVSLHGAEMPLRARQVVSVVFVESDATWLVFASASVRWLCTYGRTAPLGGPSVVVPAHPPVRQHAGLTTRAARKYSETSAVCAPVLQRHIG